MVIQDEYKAGLRFLEVLSLEKILMSHHPMPYVSKPKTKPKNMCKEVQQIQSIKKSNKVVIFPDD